MRTLSHYLIVMLMVLLFIFRLIVLFTTTMGIDFSVVSSNPSMEVVVLIVTLVSIILVSKSKALGPIIMIVVSALYYGPEILSSVNLILKDNVISANGVIQLTASLISTLIPVAAFFIVMFAKEQEKRPVDKKTDFFYKNEAYDRQHDDRADKNNYRTL